MSWTCPHNEKEHCRLRRKPCAPGAVGCVLAGRFIMPAPETDPAPGTAEPGPPPAPPVRGPTSRPSQA